MLISLSEPAYRPGCVSLSHCLLVLPKLNQAHSSVDTAVFSMSSGPGSLFNVDSFAQSAVAASSVASGLGISCDAWFLLRYNWADLHTFRVRIPLPPVSRGSLFTQRNPPSDTSQRPVRILFLLLALSETAIVQHAPLGIVADGVSRTGGLQCLAGRCHRHLHPVWHRDVSPVPRVRCALVLPTTGRRSSDGIL